METRRMRRSARSVAIAYLRGIERLGRLAARRDRVAARIAVSPALEIRLRAFEQRLCLVERLRDDLVGAGIASRLDRLTRVAHLLNGSARARGQRDACDERQNAREPPA